MTASRVAGRRVRRRRSRARLARDSRTGAAANRLGVVTAAAGTGPSGGHDEREVRAARRLDARGRRPPPRTRPGSRATRSTAGRSAGSGARSGSVARDIERPRCGDGGRGGGQGGERAAGASAGGLGQAVDDVERLDRLAGGALDEVVEDADREDPAVALVEAAPDPGLVGAEDVLRRRRRRRRRSRTARRRRRRAYSSSSSACVTGAGRPDVARGQDPAGHRDEVGQEVDATDARVRARRRRARPAPARSRRCGGG